VTILNTHAHPLDGEGEWLDLNAELDAVRGNLRRVRDTGVARTLAEAAVERNPYDREFLLRQAEDMRTIGVGRGLPAVPVVDGKVPTVDPTVDLLDPEQERRELEEELHAARAVLRRLYTNGIAEYLAAAETETNRYSREDLLTTVAHWRIKLASLPGWPGRCGRGDLNPYARRHRLLRPARLPFRHSRGHIECTGRQRTPVHSAAPARPSAPREPRTREPRTRASPEPASPEPARPNTPRPERARPEHALRARPRTRPTQPQPQPARRHFPGKCRLRSRVEDSYQETAARAPWGQSMPRSRRSLATCPVALTLYMAFSIFPAASITNVDRITPVTVRP
jgi:hypothetical protein